ncbi:hypothetical protein [Kitasatospora phosalacinea]|uniref:Uncharacterized protein n=1 Tax=Kitasatospora phosalacinea TaxID=2065 RepID=A0A9W6URI6_9ACTN|nr:hypothetical protein [Kitasatospora phosalacinea]GLW59546.1 hypothetical protein Kpho01_75560 [Kitasatospora phosalacinea]
MTSLDQNASDRPHADANRRAVKAGSADGSAGGSASEGTSEGAAANANAGASVGAGAGTGTGAPGAAVEWSSGVWSVGEMASRARPQRRPAPSRRLSQVRAVPSAGHRAVAEEAAAGAEGVPVDLVGVPMGVLIGGSPGLAEGVGPGGRAPDRRVSAQLLRFGSGTCQVVLPEWRSAIAVSVPTEQLQRSTGLSPEELRSALLSVVINPEAVHDRELGMRDWQAELPSARGRRRGRRPVR